MDTTKILIEKVKAGDEDAFRTILKKHDKMIYKIIYSLDIYQSDFSIDYESLYQEGTIALYDAIFTYQEDKGMQFSSYAFMVVRSRVYSALREFTRQYEEEKYSIDNHPNIDYCLSMTNLAVAENPIDYHRSKQLEETLNRFIADLPQIDQEILALRYEDLSYRQISERLNINQKKIDNRLRSLRKRLKKYLQEDE